MTSDGFGGNWHFLWTTCNFRQESTGSQIEYIGNSLEAVQSDQSNAPRVSITRADSRENGLTETQANPARIFGREFGPRRSGHQQFADYWDSTESAFVFQTSPVYWYPETIRLAVRDTLIKGVA
ncbi:hypothetical protein C8F04DRAFT_1175846 [Mycena alexandri]|uniref:Uncharacterized protein n=1 Tax=Mycena alexandri TaxID=1745969 RepID=A0AAD6XEW0_9AGAR|nr:hypothetical protein C8F04DRAFT_1175846 [Mycena alexandri]